ncbi:HAD family hydrolase [Reichenbachiella versicolor]|uniref:HAD family hydrolase n=1 Tax=Reichenbachiella versicolor TaxID=1821036 RepID=UPI0013A52ECC|nr:HAD family phosphatase [Reichenbachiella versicolor]
MNINTIIFDLGGVIIDLDEEATVKALTQLSDLPSTQVLEAYQSALVFKEYEKGLISSDKFRSEIRFLLKSTNSDSQVDFAWNAMLGNIPIERLNLMSRLRKNYQVMVLSNTNAIHERAFNKIIENVSGKKNLNDFADKVFFSHELNLRKPDIEIYEKIIEISDINPNRAIFLDDKLENLKGAEKAGLNTFHIPNPNKTLDIEQYIQQ